MSENDLVLGDFNEDFSSLIGEINYHDVLTCMYIVTFIQVYICKNVSELIYMYWYLSYVYIEIYD